MVTLANELQPSKAANPIPVTELGMVTLANELQPLKAKFPIRKAPVLIEAAELEMVTLTNELQPLKAASSIAITSPGISTTNKSSTSQLEAGKLEHTTGWMLRKARTSAPGMASDTSSSLFTRGLSPTTTSTELMGAFWLVCPTGLPV